MPNSAGATNNKEALESLQDDSILQDDAAQFAIHRHQLDLQRREEEPHANKTSSQVRRLTFLVVAFVAYCNRHLYACMCIQRPVHAALLTGVAQSAESQTFLLAQHTELVHPVSAAPICS